MMLAGIFVWLFGVAVDAFAGNGVTPGPDDFRSAMLVTAGLISMSILLLALISSHNRTPAPRMT
jgi:hypothetical protein